MRSFKPAQHFRFPRVAVARMVWPLVVALPVVLGGCASIVIHDRPVFDRTSLETPSTTTPPPAEAVGLVQAGVVLDKKHPEWAVTYYRDAALKALLYIQSEELSPQLDIDNATGAQGIYRRAIEYTLETTHRQAKVEGISWTEFLARAGIGVHGRVGLYEAARWEEALPTRRFRSSGLPPSRGPGRSRCPRGPVAHSIGKMG